MFCGSQVGGQPLYAAAATAVGTLLALRGIGLVYGGGKVGLMGVLADAALAAGGEVIGVIPERLMNRELGHGGVTDLRVVDSMHERKALMNDLSDAFILFSSVIPAVQGAGRGSSRQAGVDFAF